MKCLETRRRNGMVYRRYLMPDGTAYSTYEVPAAVVRNVGYQRFIDAARLVKRGEESRALAEAREALVANADPALSSTEVAKLIGITSARVRQIRAKIKFAKENTK